MCDHAQILCKLINGVLTREERAEVLKWCVRFADTSTTNQTQHFSHENRTTKCSVCAFICRSCVIEEGLGKRVKELDISLHTVGVYLPVNWTIICILGGILMDTYISSVDAEFDTWFLQPGDIIHHYMISSGCIYNDIGPMVALRDTCSFLTQHTTLNNKEHDFESEEDFPDSKTIVTAVNTKHRKGQRKQKLGHSVISMLLSMIPSSDVSAGKCKDMAYLPISNKAHAAVMGIPNYVMLHEDICDQLQKQGGTNRNQELGRTVNPAENFDNLYDIYTQLPYCNERDDACLVISERQDGVGTIKASRLMLETHQWMKAVVDTVYSRLSHSVVPM